MALNAIASKNGVVSDVLYCPEPRETLDGEGRMDNNSRKNFQKRISEHIFESVGNIRESENENKPKFIFVPYKIGIYMARKEYKHTNYY